MFKVLKVLRVPIASVTYWSDSMIVLAWLRSEPNKWKTFVFNRVAEIQSLSELSVWRHVDSANNPADIVSRGWDPCDLKTCSMWWNGPDFLLSELSQWPILEATEIPVIPKARKSNMLVSFITINSLEDPGIFAH